MESQSEEESHDEEENQEEAQDDTGSHQEGSENSKETHQEGSQDSNTSQENENNSSDAPEGEPAEDQSSDDDNNPEFQTLMRNGPMPSIVPFSGGGGVQDTIQVFKTANRHLGKCRQFEVELKITGEPQPIPVDVVVVIDKSGSMNETVDAIVGNPVAGSDYSILVGSNQDYYPITHHSGNVWKYEYRVNNGTQTRYIQYDPSGSNTSTGSTSSSGSSSYKKPFYYNRLHYAKKAANDFVDKVLGTNGIAGSRVALVTFSGPSTVTGQGSSSQAQRVVNLTSNINTLKTNINNITAIGGTNTQAGFNAARDEILANASANSNKFVVMFTDGVPIVSFLTCCVVSILEWPSLIAMVEISTLALRRFIATECLNVCGVIFFSSSVGFIIADASTMTLILKRIPERVSLLSFLFRKIGSVFLKLLVFMYFKNIQ